MKCEHKEVEWQNYQPTRTDEPGCSEGWLCQECGELVPVDEATKSGVNYE